MSEKNILKQSSQKARNTLASYNTRKKAAKKINGSINVNRAYFKNKADNLLVELENIIAEIRNPNKPIGDVGVSIDSIAEKIGVIRNEFASQLRSRLVDTLKQNGTYNVYLYYSVKNFKVPNNNKFENALNATTSTINNYAEILKSLNGSVENLKSGATAIGSMTWPVITAMDDILKNYNSAATRVQSAQNVNVKKLNAEIVILTSKIKNIENAENKIARNKLIAKLEKLKMAIKISGTS